MSLTEPTLMGSPKGMGGEVQGNCTIDVIFVINHNFLNKNPKNSHENVFYFQFYICCANFIGICQKMSDLIIIKFIRKIESKTRCQPSKEPRCIPDIVI